MSNLLTRSQLLARFSGQQLHEHQNTNLQNTNSHTHSRHNHGCSDSYDRGSTDEHTRKQHALTSSKGTRKRKRWGNSHNSSDNDDDDDNKDDHSISNDGDDARKGTSKTDDGTNSGDSRDTSYRGAGDDDEKKDTSALQNVVRKLRYVCPSTCVCARIHVISLCGESSIPT